MTRAVQALYGPDLDLWLLGHSWGGALGTLMLVDTDVQPEISGWIEASGCHDDIQGFRHIRTMFEEIGDAEIAAGRNVAEWEEIQQVGAGYDDATELPFDVAVEVNQAGYQAESLIDEISPAEFSGKDLWDQLATNPVRRSVGKWSGTFTQLDAKYDLATLSLEERLPEITVPSLFLYGTYDFVCPPQLGRDAPSLVGSELTRFVEMERSGHSTMLNEPVAFTDAVLDFMDEAAGSP